MQIKALSALQPLPENTPARFLGVNLVDFEDTYGTSYGNTRGEKRAEGDEKGEGDAGKKCTRVELPLKYSETKVEKRQPNA